MTDDQDIYSLPVMRKLMSYPEGSWVQFTNAFTNVALCGPSRATFLTGQYAHHNQVTGNNGQRLDVTNTLPVWLDNAGYRTGLIGKYMNGLSTTPRPLPPGWDYFVFPKLQRDVDLYADLASSFINESEEPFFLFLAFKGPHRTAKPPARYRNADVYVPPRRPNVNEADMSDKPLYMRRWGLIKEAKLRFMEEERTDAHRELMGIDDTIQQIINTLKAKGVLDETLIIFTSDNGFSWGSHRKLGKLCPYEECSNVPLLIRYPGLVGNRIEERVVSNVDIPTTIADYAGVTPSIPQDGRSLLPILDDPQASWPDIALMERHLNSYYGVRTTGWTYIEYRTGERELYDLTNDPYQMQNVAGRPQYVDIQTDLAGRLSQLLAANLTGGAVGSADGQPILDILATDQGLAIEVVP